MPEAPAVKAPSAKRDHLLETAWRLFYRDGYHAVGIDTILAEAGVAKMTLYNHFSSKEDLIVAVLERRHHEFEASLNAAIEAAGKAPLKRLLAVFDWLEDWIKSPSFNGCAFIRAVGEYPQPDERPHQVSAQHKASLIDLLTRLAKEAGAYEPTSIGRQLALLMEGAIVTAHTFGPDGVAADTREAALRLLRHRKAR